MKAIPSAEQDSEFGGHSLGGRGRCRALPPWGRMPTAEWALFWCFCPLSFSLESCSVLGVACPFTSHCRAVSPVLELLTSHLPLTCIPVLGLVPWMLCWIAWLHPKHFVVHRRLEMGGFRKSFRGYTGLLEMMRPGNWKVQGQVSGCER